MLPRLLSTLPHANGCSRHCMFNPFSSPWCRNHCYLTFIAEETSLRKVNKCLSKGIQLAYGFHSWPASWHQSLCIHGTRGMVCQMLAILRHSQLLTPSKDCNLDPESSLVHLDSSPFLAEFSPGDTSDPHNTMVSLGNLKLFKGTRDMVRKESMKDETEDSGASS